MAKHIIILGAGASAQYGAPVMANFMEMARDLRIRRKRSEPFLAALERVDAVLAALQVAHSKSDIDLRNIESILTALEMANIIEKLVDSPPEEIPDRIDDLKLIIDETLRLTPSGRNRWSDKDRKDWDLSDDPERGPRDAFPPSEIKDLIRVISKKNRSSGVNSTAFLSFNYDLILDASIASTHHLGASLSKCTVDYGLGSQPQVDPILLLKLHGSLNWFEKAGTKEIQAIHVEESMDKGVVPRFSEFPILGSEVRRESKKLGCSETPIIVPPSWNKFESYGKIRPIWKRAASELQDAERISVVGYSLPSTDTFFSHLYALGTIGPKQLRSFRVYDVTDSSKNRFKDLLGNGARHVFEMIRCDASCAFEDIAKRMENEI